MRRASNEVWNDSNTPPYVNRFNCLHNLIFVANSSLTHDFMTFFFLRKGGNIRFQASNTADDDITVLSIPTPSQQIHCDSLFHFPFQEIFYPPKRSTCLHTFSCCSHKNILTHFQNIIIYFRICSMRQCVNKNWGCFSATLKSVLTARNVVYNLLICNSRSVFRAM